MAYSHINLSVSKIYHLVHWQNISESMSQRCIFYELYVINEPPQSSITQGCMGTRLVSQFYHSNSSECCNYPLLQPCPTPGLQFTGGVSPLISCSWVATITIMQIFLSRYPGSNILSSLNFLGWVFLGSNRNLQFDSSSKRYSMFQTLI